MPRDFRSFSKQNEKVINENQEKVNQYEDILKGSKAIYKLNEDNSYSLIKEGSRYATAFFTLIHLISF